MLRMLLAAALALAAPLAAGHGQAAAGPVRNVVMVHGAYADGSRFAKVIPLLRARGLNVLAVQNPLTSLAADVEATRRAIARMDGPVILVGHSSAGVVITEAGNDPKVAGLVYISAIAPDAGQSTEDAVRGYPPTPGMSQQKADVGGYLWLTREGADQDFVPDLPPAERELVYVTQGPWNTAFLREKVTTAAWRTRPSWFIAVNDRMVPPTYERDAARRMNATLVELDSGHVPMLSHPDRVAEVIIEAATRAGRH